MGGEPDADATVEELRVTETELRQRAGDQLPPLGAMQVVINVTDGGPGIVRKRSI